MTHTAIPWHPPRRVLRQFAALSLVCAAVLTWRGGRPPGGAGRARPAGGGGAGRLVSAPGGPPAARAAVVGVVGAIRPGGARLPFLALFLLTFPIGWVVSQVVLATLFYLVFTPVGIAFRLAGRDALALRPTDRPSHWLPRQPTTDAGRYFRQF